MSSLNLNYYVSVYKKELENGDLQVAYSDLLKFLQKLKSQLAKELIDDYTLGNIFQGYLVYSYFYLSSPCFSQLKLKLGLVLNHKEM